MHAEILSIGTELLMGELVDTNSSYLASELAKLGIETHWVTKVGDDPERLYRAIERANRRSDVTLTSGGLGPTSDDLTRESIARVCGEEMTVQDDLLEHLKGLFANRGFPMPETNVKQATLIPSAQAIDNPMGTAPGWWVEHNGGVIAAMPGPPRELQNMWANEVAPRLKALNAGVSIVTRNLKTFGISEGGLDEMLSPLFKSENPSLGIYSKQDGIHLRAIATASTDAAAEALIAPMEAEIRRIVGDDAIWGIDGDTPESKAISRLREHGLTLAIADDFTGGVLTSRLSAVEGAGGVLRGSVIASTDALNEQGANISLSPSEALFGRMGDENLRIAELMAQHARERFNADVGLGMTGYDWGGWYAGFALRDADSLQSAPIPMPLSWRSSGFSMNALRRSGRDRLLGRSITHTLLLFESYIYGKMRPADAE